MKLKFNWFICVYILCATAFWLLVASAWVELAPESPPIPITQQ